MIGRLTGRVGYIAEDHALIDVGGVGYLVHCSSRTLAGLPRVGEAATLYTELEIREDHWRLVGFPSVIEREWHRLLTGVQGVGSKSSLAILGALGPEGVSRALALEDATMLRRAPGVGPKIAQRILLDLKGKAPAVMALGATAPASVAAPAPMEVAPTPGAATAMHATDESSRAAAEALSALSNLGYAPMDAAAAVARAAEGGAKDTAALIKAALKALAPKN